VVGFGDGVSSGNSWQFVVSKGNPGSQRKSLPIEPPVLKSLAANQKGPKRAFWPYNVFFPAAFAFFHLALANAAILALPAALIVLAFFTGFAGVDLPSLTFDQRSF
jgi:hypothetical protein